MQLYVKNFQIVNLKHLFFALLAFLMTLAVHAKSYPSLKKALLNPEKTTELKISAEELATFASQTNKFSSLRTLVIKKGEINHFDEKLILLTQLKHIRFEKIRFNANPDFLRELPLLEKVTFKKTKGLTQLSHDTSGWYNIVELEFIKTKYIPHDLERIKNLKKLTFHKVRVEALPANVVELDQLEYLTIRGGKIRALPERFAKLQNLRVLRLRRTRIKEFPYELCEMNLRSLEFEAGNRGTLELPYKCDERIHALDFEESNRAFENRLVYTLADIGMGVLYVTFEIVIHVGVAIFEAGCCCL